MKVFEEVETYGRNESSINNDKIDEDMDKEITLKEVTLDIKKIKSGKSIATNGFSPELFKAITGHPEVL